MGVLKFCTFLLLIAQPAFLAVPKTYHNEFITILLPFRENIQEWARNIGRDGDDEIHSNIGIQADYFGCNLCTAVMPFIKEAIEKYQFEEIKEIVVNACKALNLAPKDSICVPMINSYAEQFLYIFSNAGKDICGILNSGCGNVNSSLTDWDINIDANKPDVVERPRIPDDVGEVKIVQFSDIHLDLDYKEGTDTECGDGMPICCRGDGLGDGEVNNVTSPAGKYGDFKCALPLSALTEIYNDAARIHSDAKYVFLTGDYVHSGVWLYSKEENGRHIQKATVELVDAFQGINAKIYPLTGNHEAHVVNLYPPVDKWDQNDGNFSLSWMYGNVSAPFIARDNNLLPPQELERFNKFGYYSVSPEERLRIIAINTNLCYTQNFWLGYYPIDPYGQLQWLADELLKAERADENVIIIGHVQPGSCWQVWSEKFHLILDRFEGIVRGQFYGHSHKPQFRVAFEKGIRRATGVSFIAGSALTDGMNPGYAVYYLDGARSVQSTWDLIRQDLMIMKLKESNTKKEPVFQKLISTDKDFGMKDLRPETVYGFVKRMICDQGLIDRYLEYHHKGSDSLSYKSCSVYNSTCKVDLICNLVTSDSSDQAPCKEITREIESTECGRGAGVGNNGSNIRSYDCFVLFCLIFFKKYVL